jgi:CBS domain-containing protein
MEIRNLVGGAASVCGPDLTVAEAAKVMIDQGIGSIGVIDQGALVGIFTERDALRVTARSADPSTEKVSDWMTPDPDRLTPDVEVEDAAEWLLATGYRHLPVVEDGVLLGVVSIKDVLWALSEPNNGGE